MELGVFEHLSFFPTSRIKHVRSMYFERIVYGILGQRTLHTYSPVSVERPAKNDPDAASLGRIRGLRHTCFFWPPPMSGAEL